MNGSLVPSSLPAFFGGLGGGAPAGPGNLAGYVAVAVLILIAVVVAIVRRRR